MNSTNVVSTILTPQTSDISLADLNDFLIYLREICAFILGFTSSNSINMDRFFVDQSSHDSIEKFIHDARCQILFVSNINSSTESSSSSFNVYVLSHEFNHIDSKCLSLVLLKRNPTIIDDNYHNQLRIIDFIDPKQREGLFDELIDGQRIHLPEIILTTHVIAVQNIKTLIDNIIQGTMNNKSTDQNHQDQDDDDDMMMFRFSFTNAFDNYNRAAVYDAMVAFSLRTAAQNRSNTPYQIRRIADPNYIFQPGEQFDVLFNTQGSFICFHAWLSRTYGGHQHVLTIIQPAAFSMNLIV